MNYNNSAVVEIVVKKKTIYDRNNRKISKNKRVYRIPGGYVYF